MNRDMDLVRRIALATGDLPAGEQLRGLDGVPPEVFAQHVEWMQEAGLVAAIISASVGGPRYAAVSRLTWSGCDFADVVRDDTLWLKAKEKVLKPSASWTFGLLTEWLKAEISQGFPTLRRVSE